MVPLMREWTPFKDHQDALEHYRRWGLISPAATELRSVMVVDDPFEPPQPCRVVGYETGFENWAVIELNGTYSGIHGDYLADMQPVAYQPIPRGVTFADILSRYVILNVSATTPATVSATIFSYGRPEKNFSGSADVLNSPTALSNFIGLLPIMHFEADGNTVSEFLCSIGVSNTLLSIPLMVQKVYPGLAGTSLQYLCASLGLEHNADPVNDANHLLWACMTFRRHEMAYRTTCMNERTTSLPPLAVAPVTPAVPPFVSSAVDQSVLPQSKPVPPINVPVARKSTPIVNSNPTAPDEYIVLDIETTGLDRYEDRIIEIAAIKVLNGDTVGKFQTLVNPQCDLPPFITKLTGIMQMEVDIAPTLDEIKPEFYSFIGLLPLVGHNIKAFDAPFIVAQMNQPFSNELIDTLLLARKAFPGFPHHTLEFLNENLSLGSTTSHRAMADVETTAKLYQLCLNPRAEVNSKDKAERGKYPPTPEEEQAYNWLAPALKRVVADNNTPSGWLVLDGCKDYSSVWYGSQIAFRICYRGRHHYFGVSNSFIHLVPDELSTCITASGKKDGFTNFEFSLNRNDIAKFTPFLSSVLNAAIDKLPKDYDCCSRYEECSNAKRCIHPNPAMAIGCGYRKILKSGRIFYGPNRNIK